MKRIFAGRAVALGLVVAGCVLIAGCAGIAGTAGPGESTGGTSSSSTSSTSVTAGTAAPPCPAGTAGAAPTRAAPTIDPKAVPVISVSAGANAWIASPLTEPLRLTVYPDGTALYTSAFGERSAPLPEFRAVRLSACLVNWGVAQLTELGDLDMGVSNVTDQGTTVISYRTAGGAKRTIEIYAFGLDEYVDAAQQANRARLHGVLAALSEPAAQGSVWQPSRLRIVATVGTDDGTVYDWPSSVPLKQVLIYGRKDRLCGVVEGRDAQAVMAELNGGSSAASWKDADGTRFVTIGALVPGQPGCIA